MSRPKSKIRRNRARKDSRNGLLGASSDGNGKFKSVIFHNGKKKNLGHFCTPEEAHAKYVAEALILGIEIVN